ncbi:hypothetical protein PIB30_035408 [Stylosanthes scabra]|uniref:Uncharacterized protein n=1 Tax=Stylosanthes scabra TaxID=79078 RepID=A0ABU6QDF5_9FABA|nr:hypothetical protein [Stylosanthes scabra]
MVSLQHGPPPKAPTIYPLSQGSTYCHLFGCQYPRYLDTVLLGYWSVRDWAPGARDQSEGLLGSRVPSPEEWMGTPGGPPEKRLRRPTSEEYLRLRRENVNLAYP